MGQIREFYFQPDAPDPTLSNGEVLRCVRRFWPGASAVTAVDETGGEARTYLVDDQIVLKVQRPPQVRVSTSLAKEVFFLNQLAASDATLPVPAILGYARESNLLEYNLQTRMPGVAFANAPLPPEQQQAVIFSVGRLLRRVHGSPQKPLRESAHFPTDHTAADFRVRLGDYFTFLGRRLRESGRAWPLKAPLDQIAERTVRAVPETLECVAVHANPGPPHVFVDPHTGQFTGLIDFGDAYISHPVMDLWRWRAPQHRPHVLAGYTADGPVSDEFRQVWKCVSILNDVLLIVYFPEQTTEALEDLSELLKEVL
jgi:aminoglycoside phosphotransferase (APT) family kinase protein